MSTEFSLEFENVNKSFGPDKKVVDNVSFGVKNGEFFSLLGPSGCGKTTALRMISGLDTPDSGIIRLNGKVVNDVHPHKRNVHMVFQKYALFPHLNVYDNVAFGLRMKKLPESTIKDRVTRMLKMVRLEDYTNRTIQLLSGGEQQRVALVRALVNEPALLLLDEPLGALDLKLREQMQTELAALQKQLGITFVFVTHDQWEALTLSDRIAIMNKGRLEQIGTPTEVYEHPHTAFVSKFVGTTNLFKGQAVVNGSDQIHIQNTPVENLHAKLDPNKTAPTNNAGITVVVRPEKIRLRHSLSHDDRSRLNVLHGKLIERTYFGATTQVKLQYNDNEQPLIALLANQTATKMPTLNVGEKYYAVWDPSDCVLVTDV